MSRRLKHLTDLYTEGVPVLMKDGSPVWMQALNPFEQDTARNEATIAKARLTFAVKEHGSDEQLKVKLFFFEGGRDQAVKNLVDAKTAGRMLSVVDGIRNDPEWTEKLRILDRGLDETATPPEEGEREVVHEISVEYLTLVGERMESERAFFQREFEEADEETLWAAYLEWYLDRRSNEASMAEYRLHQLYFGARICEGTCEDGVWDHAACDGHQERLFATKEEVREAPGGLQMALLDALEEFELTVREAKNSDRQGSSSDSSPLPSAPAESTASTPTETRDEPLGTSPSPSPTPSPSLASTS